MAISEPVQRRSGLKTWQKHQKAQKQRWKKETEEYGDLARKIHKLFQQLAVSTPCGNINGHLNSYYSIESSSFWPHLLKTAALVTAHNFDPKTHLIAQFDFFRAYKNTIPFPAQLCSVNAIDRTIAYIANQELKLEQKREKEAAAPKVNPKLRAKENMRYWKNRVTTLARPRGASDRDAVILHCEDIPPEVLMEFGVWDEVKVRWQRANG